MSSYYGDSSVPAGGANRRAAHRTVPFSTTGGPRQSSGRSARLSARTGGQFRPRPLAPPPPPAYIVPLEVDLRPTAITQAIASGLAQALQRAALSGNGLPSADETAAWCSQISNKLRHKSVNKAAYDEYLATYDTYLGKLSELRSSFWTTAKAASAAPPENTPRPSSPDRIMPSAEVRKRRAAARRRQRAARSARDAEKRAQNLKVELETARLEKQLRTAKSGKVATRDKTTKAKVPTQRVGSNPDVEVGSGSNATVTSAPQGSTPTPGAVSLRRTPAQRRRAEHRYAVFGPPTGHPGNDGH